MRMSTTAAAIAGCAVLMVIACQGSPVEERVSCVEEIRKEKEDCEKRLAEHNSVRAAEHDWSEQLAAALMKADEALTEIEKAEPDLMRARHEIESGEDESTDRSDRVLQRIAGLQKRLTDARATLAEQMKQNAKAIDQNKIMKAALEGRDRALRAKVQKIKELETSLQTAATEIAEAKVFGQEREQERDEERRQREAAETENVELRRALSTRYYVVMPENDLVRAGILRKERFLWRRSLRIAELPVSQFETLNIYDRQSIELNYPKERLRIASQHPASSFEIISTAPNESSLRIRDVEAFWSTRFLVVAVKQ